VSTLPFVPVAHTVIGEAEDVGTETRWRVRLADGTTCVVGQLVPDLAREESIRRRYVRDVERVKALEVYALAPTIAMGPMPDPRDPSAEPPWRMRLDPDGEPLQSWLVRAPLPIEEVSAVFASVADSVYAVHATGVVLRDLRPDQIVRIDGGRFVLTDVGLARVDVLSSHTASSLLLRGSTYVAPEQLLKNAIDQRSDLWSVGMMMWQALTGSLPFGDGPPLLAEHHRLPSLHTVRGDVPPMLDEIVRRCLEVDVGKRPASAGEIAWVLRGGHGQWQSDETTVCQHCQSRLRVGQRLCLACGRLAVRFEHAQGREGWALELVSLSEQAEPLRWLQSFIHDVSAKPVLDPEFLIGSVHMYSDEEKHGRIRLPARLYGNLTEDTASALEHMARDHGVRVRVVSPREVARAGTLLLGWLGLNLIVGALLELVGITGWWVLCATIPGLIGLLAHLNNKVSDRRKLPRYRLRSAPAALPASDPLVARLAALLSHDPPGDVRQVIGELALVVQRLVDHRASFLGDTREIDALTSPIEPLVTAIEAHAVELARTSSELATLDEGTMVRALAASEARDDPAPARVPILEGLDRLRALEDRRAELFHRLLEAKSLLERTVRLGLQVHDPAREQERQVALALATLQG
jgi:hypothetical protein